ncbi:proline-rich receptor-like protein kinase PERK10 [Papaver somniferum]|uniref:proline-rich receptor-like protein kinase PERK10 n=1 Tax=Papaver somniferum TaxID=3469 RepID=UPI000E700855|nr:proline-rich receptor-like protein kinase PERK10 [Papaver somniferum]
MKAQNPQPKTLNFLPNSPSNIPPRASTSTPQPYPISHDTHPTLYPTLPQNPIQNPLAHPPPPPPLTTVSRPIPIRLAPAMTQQGLNWNPVPPKQNTAATFSANSKERTQPVIISDTEASPSTIPVSAPSSKDYVSRKNVFSESSLERAHDSGSVYPNPPSSSPFTRPAQPVDPDSHPTPQHQIPVTDGVELGPGSDRANNTATEKGKGKATGLSEFKLFNVIFLPLTQNC